MGMRSNSKQVISYNTRSIDVQPKYGIGIWNISYTTDANKATNYKYLWILKYIALKNFKNRYPKELRKFINFENIVLMFGSMSGMFGGLFR
jgi:hypothetical protein